VAAKANLKAIVDALESQMTSDQSRAFFDLDTGEVHEVTLELIGAAEEGEGSEHSQVAGTGVGTGQADCGERPHGASSHRSRRPRVGDHERVLHVADADPLDGARRRTLGRPHAAAQAQEDGPIRDIPHGRVRYRNILDVCPSTLSSASPREVSKTTVLR
jgi:hypothetical protein